MTKISKPALAHLRATDLRAAALLATNATRAVTTIAEGVHQAIWRTVGAPSGATPSHARGLTGLVYQGIQGATQWVGRGVVAALSHLEPLLQQLEGQPDESPERAAVVAAINGVMGDRLAAANNPLAIPMTLRVKERDTNVSKGLQLDLPLKPQLPQAGSKVLLVLHGLCMNDLQWNTPCASGAGNGDYYTNHATALTETLGYTPIYLRYNTGLHISENALLLMTKLGKV